MASEMLISFLRSFFSRRRSQQEMKYKLWILRKLEHRTMMKDDLVKEFQREFGAGFNIRGLLQEMIHGHLIRQRFIPKEYRTSPSSGAYKLQLEDKGRNYLRKHRHDNGGEK